MSFSRVKPLGWALFETLASADMNQLDIDHARAVDGHSGGAYNPTAAIVINNQFEVDATGAAGANVIGIIATGKGTQAGVNATGGATSGPGVFGTGGAPDGEGLVGTGVGAGTGVIGTGGPTNGAGLLGLGTGTGAGVVGTGGVGGAIGGDFTGTGALQGVKGTGGGTDGTGVTGDGGAVDGMGGSFTGAGSGHGVLATGGATNGIGLVAIGKLTGDGIQAEGGLTSGRGVYGIGKGTGVGVHGAGATGGSAFGVTGVGGTANGGGVRGDGKGSGVGIYGAGGNTDAHGGHFIGGATNGSGVYAHAQGTGTSVKMSRTTGPHINMFPVAGDPAAPANGDVWVTSVAGPIHEIVAYMGDNKHQLLDTWVHGTTNGTGAIAINADNNVAGLAIDAANDLIEVTFARPFGIANYAVTITMDHPAFQIFPVVVAQLGAPGTGFSFAVYDNAGGPAIDPAAVAFSFGIVIKGYFA